ncbi:uncharacterized protein LOC124455128 [Xenia sp. Carnegie-2017]|uniref:uncharacterized protein LOC124455128 n=1 Tax=Xenia sp. Carnegie-2017 TaxID=2897299 RepID=UPI001F035226|nr:uncharacterized protein LOC124455128 [Xenia sp. Carnegie-2017]
MKLLASYETPGFDFFEAHIFSTVLVILDYILSSTGRFDLNWFTVHLLFIWKWSPISVDSIIESGWWPGSPENFHYIFSQDVFNLWDAFRKRMPGSSQSAFVRSLEDISSSRGREIVINHLLNGAIANMKLTFFMSRHGKIALLVVLINIHVMLMEIKKCTDSAKYQGVQSSVIIVMY